MICFKCGKELLEVPVFNDGDELYPHSFPFCNNIKCSRFGLLTVVFKHEDKKDSDKGDKSKSVQPDKGSPSSSI